MMFAVVVYNSDKVVTVEKGEDLNPKIADMSDVGKNINKTFKVMVTSASGGGKTKNLCVEYNLFKSIYFECISVHFYTIL